MAQPLNLNFSPGQVQGAAIFIFWIFIGLIIFGGFLWLLWEIIKSSKYKVVADLREKVGDSYVAIPDKARSIRVEDEALFHYRSLNKYSPVFGTEYFYIVKKKVMGLFEQTFIGFTGIIMGDKIVPCKIHDNPGIVPIDYDAWNYMVGRIRQNHAKHEKNLMMRQMMPYIALFGVIVAFIIGSVLWGQHVEKIATQILQNAQTTANAVLQNSGSVQIIGGGG